MVAPGWYEDPHGGGGQRWWDGERWSEHTAPAVQPAAPAAPPAPPAPPAAVPGQAVPGQAAPGQAVPEQHTSWQPTAGQQGSVTPDHQGGPSSGGSSSGGKLLAVLAGLVVLVVVIGVGVWALVGGGDDAVEADTIATGDSFTYEVAEDGSWELDLDAPGGLVVIDVRGLDGFDPVAELVDPSSGERIGRNDDRSTAHLDEYGGDRLDSLLELDLSAGSYRLVVTGFGGQGGDGVVTFPVVGG